MIQMHSPFLLVGHHTLDVYSACQSVKQTPILKKEGVGGADPEAIREL